MTSAQVVKITVTNNSSFQNHSWLTQTIRRYDLAKFLFPIGSLHSLSFSAIKYCSMIKWMCNSKCPILHLLLVDYFISKIKYYTSCTSMIILCLLMVWAVSLLFQKLTKCSLIAFKFPKSQQTTDWDILQIKKTRLMSGEYCQIFIIFTLQR